MRFRREDADDALDCGAGIIEQLTALHQEPVGQNPAIFLFICQKLYTLPLINISLLSRSVMRRAGETEYEYQQRISREGYDRDDKFGGMGAGIATVGTSIIMFVLNTLLALLLLLPEPILFPVATVLSVQLLTGLGALVVLPSYYITLDIILLSILFLIWYLRKKFKHKILGATNGNFKMSILSKFLYEETDKAKRLRVGTYFLWIMLFIWLFPY